MRTIHFWRYALRSVSRLNAVSGRTKHPGALIRVDGGYGCIHPWPELGDLPLEEQLVALASGMSTGLIRQALRCAAADATARREGRSLFQGSVPESHWLVMSDAVPPPGFRKVKLKVGPEMADGVGSVQKWVEDGFRVRLDANEAFTFSEVRQFWQDLGSAREQVEWFEDPIPWELETWAALREDRNPSGSGSRGRKSIQRKRNCDCETGAFELDSRCSGKLCGHFLPGSCSRANVGSG
jgi:O-succinylbenzoate synthase